MFSLGILTVSYFLCVTEILQSHCFNHLEKLVVIGKEKWWKEKGHENGALCVGAIRFAQHWFPMCVMPSVPLKTDPVGGTTCGQRSCITIMTLSSEDIDVKTPITSVFAHRS